MRNDSEFTPDSDDLAEEYWDAMRAGSHMDDLNRCYDCGAIATHAAMIRLPDGWADINVCELHSL